MSDHTPDCSHRIIQLCSILITLGVALDPDTELGSWLAWANDLADQLEQAAIQTISKRRKKPESKPSYGYNQTHQVEEILRNEVDLWQRRYIYGRR